MNIYGNIYEHIFMIFVRTDIDFYGNSYEYLYELLFEHSYEHLNEHS